MRSVIVVGGGVVGLSSALALTRTGLTVTLVEPAHQRNAASWGNAGHIAVEQVAPLASPASLRSVPRRLFVAGGALDLPLGKIGTWLPFALKLVAASGPRQFAAGSAALGNLLHAAMPAWRRLAETAGAPALLREDGHYVVWQDARAARAGRAGWQAADTGVASVHDVPAGDLARLGSLARGGIADAIRFEGSGQIADLDLLADALEAALTAAGGTIVREAAIVENVRGRARVQGFDADAVLVAAGVFSGEMMARFGHKVPIIAERGYHIRGGADGWPADLPPIVFEERSMIVTRYADCVQAASFVELSAPRAAPDPRKWARLERHVAELGLPVSGPWRRWVGSRPTLPDYLPAIGRSQRADNLFYAFGHQHLGLTLAAITGEIVADLFRGAPAAVDLAPFDIERFGKGKHA